MPVSMDERRRDENERPGRQGVVSQTGRRGELADDVDKRRSYT